MAGFELNEPSIQLENGIHVETAEENSGYLVNLTEMAIDGLPASMKMCRQRQTYSLSSGKKTVSLQDILKTPAHRALCDWTDRTD